LKGSETNLHRFCDRLRGSALSPKDDSDGKPCSGVRGDQKVSTAMADPRGLPLFLLGFPKGKFFRETSL